MKNKLSSAFLTMILIAAAILSMLYGVYCGEVNTVFNKATNICMECIGLG